MRLHTIGLIGIAALALSGTARAQTNPFLGAWNITPERPPQTSTGSRSRTRAARRRRCSSTAAEARSPAKDVKIANGELTFTIGATIPRTSVSSRRPAASYRDGRRNRHQGDRRATADVGRVRRERGAHLRQAGRALRRQNGRRLDPSEQGQAAQVGVADGAMTNEPHGNNLVSKEKFKDFRVEAEYKVSPKGNSGIYLRGRYEMQVLDDAGAGRATCTAHGDLLAQGPEKNVSKPAGEWQTAQITIVGNCVTAVLNGKTIHNNSRIPGITGGALDANETEPGPIMIQGDHEKVWFRKVVVTPITGGGSGRSRPSRDTAAWTAAWYSEITTSRCESGVKQRLTATTLRPFAGSGGADPPGNAAGATIRSRPGGACMANTTGSSRWGPFQQHKERPAETPAACSWSRPCWRFGATSPRLRRRLHAGRLGALEGARRSRRRPQGADGRARIARRAARARERAAHRLPRSATRSSARTTITRAGRPRRRLRRQRDSRATCSASGSRAPARPPGRTRRSSKQHPQRRLRAAVGRRRLDVRRRGRARPGRRRCRSTTSAT